MSPSLRFRIAFILFGFGLWVMRHSDEGSSIWFGGLRLLVWSRDMSPRFRNFLRATFLEAYPLEVELSW